MLGFGDSSVTSHHFLFNDLSSPEVFCLARSLVNKTVEGPLTQQSGVTSVISLVPQSDHLLYYSARYLLAVEERNPCVGHLSTSRFISSKLLLRIQQSS